MIRKTGSQVLFTLLSIMFLSGVLYISPAKADMMGETSMKESDSTMEEKEMMKGEDMMKGSDGMMEDKTMMNEPDSMMAGTSQMMEKPGKMGDESDNMMK